MKNKREEIERRLNTIKSTMKTLELGGVIERYKSLKIEKKQLKKQLNDLPSLEVGKWYIDLEDGKHIFCVTDLEAGYYYYYGFNSLGSWRNRDYYSALNLNRPATDKEVETALIKEAKKRGFKEGALCNNSMIKNSKFDNFLFDDRVFFYNSKVNSLEWRRKSVDDSYNEWTIFIKGKWAEIIKPKTVHIPEGDYTETQLKDILNNLYEK